MPNIINDKIQPYGMMSRVGKQSLMSMLWKFCRFTQTGFFV